MWSDRFDEKTIMFKVFSFIRECNTAVFPYEVMKKFSVINEGTLRTCLCNLSERNLIVRNDEFVRTPNGGTAQLYGINQAVISKRKIQLVEEMKQSPDKFTFGKLKSSLLKTLKESESGLTPAEIAERIGGVKQHSVSNTLNKLFRDGLVYRSPFHIPNRIENVSGNMSTVYGLSMSQVLRGISRVMPTAVKAAFIQVMNSDRIWPSWELAKRTKIDNTNMILWFKKGLCAMGLIKYRTAGNVSYYYNAALPNELVECQLAKFMEESKKWRLNITELGRSFQKRAIFVYVEYLRSKGYDVKTAEGFPEFIPNWLSDKTRKKYQTKKTNENGSTWTEYTNDVWKFDSEPVDCVIFVRDKNVDDTTVHVLTCKRDISKRYGVNYYSSFIGCVDIGRTKRGNDIPGFKTAKPVFICSETYGRQIHSFNKGSTGQAGIILTMEMMENILKTTGKKYPQEKEFRRMVQTQEAFDLYSNHIDVLLGEKTVFQMLKERGLCDDNR